MTTEGNETGGRRAPRQAVDVLVPVVNAMTQRAMGLTRDISRGGMKMQVVEPLVDQALYQVRMELPMGEGRLPVEAGAQVVRQQREPDGAVLVGLRFVHLETAHRERLGDWLLASGVDAGTS
ncbi:PilZ domain-containing protein [Marilutibacter aestuarii]|uniref:PilZ domain-containing protein n=1 Tax=Marilutibacter aestuarii TaxID=1706195 RepID=A0A508AIT1_9GAMM|nr:PilZ domain-containing protein [Lysobacter aestuarii]TQD49719.1 PilZ domain-containing protein [Lysobacter aestuarii]